MRALVRPLWRPHLSSLPSDEPAESEQPERHKRKSSKKHLVLSQPPPAEPAPPPPPEPEPPLQQESVRAPPQGVRTALTHTHSLSLYVFLVLS